MFCYQTTFYTEKLFLSVLEEKRRKEGLLAKRVELKHDRKARAMASRTKDNFQGYNGIPVEEKPRKRRGRESSSDGNTGGGESRAGDEMEELEYSPSEPEPDPGEYEGKPSKIMVKPKAPPKSAPPPMNFTDLLKLAEKKQYEPVEMKIIKKIEERPLTAEEQRERDYLERKHRKGVILKEKTEKETKPVASSSSSKKEVSHKEFISSKSNKHLTDKHSSSKGNFSSQSVPDKKSKGPSLSEKPSKLSSSSKPSHSEKAKSTHKESLKSLPSSSPIKSPFNGAAKPGSSAHTTTLKQTAHGIQKQLPPKELSLKKMSHTKPSSATPAHHESLKNSSSKPRSAAAVTGESFSRIKSSSNTGQGRPGNSLNIGHGSQGSNSVLGSGRSESSLGARQQSNSSAMGPGRPGSSTGMGQRRPGSGAGPVHPGSSQSTGTGRPSSSLSTGLGRSSSSGSGPGRPSSTSVGTLKPKCTVVSETISSKNLVPRLAGGQMNGMRRVPQQRPGFPLQGNFEM